MPTTEGFDIWPYMHAALLFVSKMLCTFKSKEDAIELIKVQVLLSK